MFRVHLVLGLIWGPIRAPIGGLLLGVTAVLAGPNPAVAQDDSCDLCLLRSTNAQGEQPLRIEIDSGLQFSRLALRGQGDGSAKIDPRTGVKRVDANTIDLGGQSWQGRVRVTGEPLRPVRIELPARVQLRSPEGGEAELSDFETDLPAGAILDEHGTLEFSFGARLSTQDGQGGNFRGRIPIRVDYF